MRPRRKLIAGGFPELLVILSVFAIAIIAGPTTESAENLVKRIQGQAAE